MKKQIQQPTKVKRIFCKCGELQIKIYPWSNLQIPEGSQIPFCKKCMNKQKIIAR